MSEILNVSINLVTESILSIGNLLTWSFLSLVILFSNVNYGGDGHGNRFTGKNEIGFNHISY